MWIFDRETLRFMAVNEAAIRYYGYSRDEFLQMTIADIRPPKDLPRLMQSLAGQEEGPRGRWRHIRKDGSFLLVEVWSHLLEFQERPARLAVVEDVTERLRAEELARATNYLLNLASRKATRQEYLDGVVACLREWSQCHCVGIRVMDERGGIPYESYTGFTPEFWARENALTVRRDQCVCTRAMQGEFLPAEKATSTAQGAFFTGSLSGFAKNIAAGNAANYRGMCIASGFESMAIIPLRHDGKVLGMMHLADPVPDRVTPSLVEFLEMLAPLIGASLDRLLLESALRRSELKYRTLFENMAQGVFYQSASGTITDVNASALEMFGLTRDQFLGRDSFDPRWRAVRADGSDFPGAEHPSMVALTTGETVRNVVAGVWHPHRQQTTWFNINAMPQFEPGAPRPFEVFVTLHDITERKRVEEELQASREQLRALAARVQAVREEERTAVAREIHDDLAQELTRLKIDITLLDKLLAPAAGNPPPAAVKDKLTEMGAITDSAIQLVQRIATNLRPVVLDSLGLCAAIEWLGREFQTHTEIVCNTVLPIKDLELGQEISTALFRILQESLTNVARHSRARHVEVILREDANLVLLRVQDDGRGVRTDQADAPSAVGLLGMRERARLLGGFCEIRGVPGKGTTVEARLPRPADNRAEDELV